MQDLVYEKGGVTAFRILGGFKTFFQIGFRLAEVRLGFEVYIGFGTSKDD